MTLVHGTGVENADSHGPLSSKGPGDRAAGEDRFLDRLEYPLPCRFANIRVAVEHARDGHMRNARKLCDIVDACPSPAHRCALRLHAVLRSACHPARKSASTLTQPHAPRAAWRHPTAPAPLAAPPHMMPPLSASSASQNWHEGDSHHRCAHLAAAGANPHSACAMVKCLERLGHLTCDVVPLIWRCAQRMQSRADLRADT